MYVCVCTPDSEYPNPHLDVGRLGGGRGAYQGSYRALKRWRATHVRKLFSSVIPLLQRRSVVVTLSHSPRSEEQKENRRGKELDKLRVYASPPPCRSSQKRAVVEQTRRIERSGSDALAARHPCSLVLFAWRVCACLLAA